MKKFAIPLLLIAVIALGLGTWYTLRNKDNKYTDFKKENANFGVEDPSSLSMIFIADKMGHNHKFELQEDNRWLVNNEWYAAPHMMEMLLNTIKKMTVKQPCPTSARNTVVKDLAVHGIKVELYTGKDKEHLKTFYVGGTTPDDLGTYFIMDKSETPFVLHIPGFNGFLTSRFEIKKHNWVDRIYFECPKDEIVRIEVAYSADTMQGFSIEKSENKFIVSDLPEADSSALNKYISYFGSTHVESFVENDNQDSIQTALESQLPYCTITLTSSTPDKNRTLKMYPFNDIDRMYGITEKDELVTIQYFVFQKFMVNRSFFEKRRIIL